MSTRFLRTRRKPANGGTHHEVELQPHVNGSKERLAAKQEPSSRWTQLGCILALCFAVLVWDGSNRKPAEPAMGTTLSAPIVVTANAANAASTAPAGRQTFRIASFNIHSGRGADHRFDLNRTAASLAGFDFVGLNEVRGGSWTDPTSQAQRLGDRLGLPCLFAPTERQWWCDHFGNGVVTSVPVRSWSRQPLVGTSGRGHRNVVLFETQPWSEQHQDRTLRILLTHLDRQQDREPQLKTVIAQFLSLPPPAVLLGDLNTTASDPHLRELLSRGDVQDAVGAKAGRDDPARIDWILTRGVRVVNSGISTGVASDHPLVWAEIEPAESTLSSN